MPAEPSQQVGRPLPGQIQRQQERIRAKLAPPDPEPSPPIDPKANADEPKPAEPPANPVPQPKVDPRKSDPAYWEQRFKVTQGILNQAREEHATALDALNVRIAELQKQLSEKTSTAVEIDLGQFFTPEQIEQHGEDQCKAMASTAVKAARSQAQALIDAEIAPLKTARANDVKRAKDERLDGFKERLIGLVPDYQEVDKDPEWIAWLNEVPDGMDPESGATRQDILDMHIGRLSAAGVGQMFREFKTTREVPKPPVPPAGGARASGTPPAPVASQGYPSKDEIRQHYRRRALKQVSDADHAIFEARLQSRATA